MSDNVIDIKTRRQPASGEHQADKRKAAEAAKERRLEEAPGIAARLRTTQRVDTNDRAIFSANLARMCGEASIDGKSSLRQIFEMAFGKDFDAKYKKRKRFVCASDDKPQSEGFAAYGADFVDLAEATAKVAYAGQPEHAIQQAKHRAILQLIESSSLDDKRPPEARLKDEAVSTLLHCLDQMVRKVEAEVDLDAMRAVIEHDAVSAIIDKNGNVEKLVSSETLEDCFPLNQREDESEESYDARTTEAWMTRKHPAERALLELLGDELSTQLMEDEHRIIAAAQHIALKEPNDEPARIFSGDLDDPSDPMHSATETSSPFAPRVVLGEIHSPPNTQGAVMLDIDEAEIQKRLAEQEYDYNAVLEKHRIAIPAPPFNRPLAHRHLLKNAVLKAMALRLGYSASWISEECNSFYDLERRIEDDDFETPENPWIEEGAIDFIARRQIELKLLRDFASERWRVCLALSHGVRQGVLGREGVYGFERDGKPFEPTMYLGYYDLGLVAAEPTSLFLHKHGENRFMLTAVGDEDLPIDDVFEISMGWLSIPSEESLDALFAPIEGSTIGHHRIEAALDRNWNRPAPAQPNTLAGMILRNLAYAPDSERYDLLLIKDARRKAKMAQKLSEERRAEFEMAINRLRH